MKLSISQLIHKYARTSNGCHNIKFWSEKLGTESKARTHLRLACCDTVLDRLSKDISNDTFYVGEYKEVIAETPEVANHYGCNVGAVIKVTREVRPHFELKCKKLLGEIKAVYDRNDCDSLFIQ